MYKLDRTEDVYQFIWRYVTQHEALPTFQQIGEGLKLPKEEVGYCVRNLRETERIEAGTLLPTAYGAWWREHVRVPGSYLAERQS